MTCEGWMVFYVTSISKIHDINLTNMLHLQSLKKTNNASLPKQQIRSILEHRENFCILRLETLSPKGLNISLNNPQDTTGSIWSSYFSSSYASSLHYWYTVSDKSTLAETSRIILLVIYSLPSLSFSLFTYII